MPRDAHKVTPVHRQAIACTDVMTLTNDVKEVCKMNVFCECEILEVDRKILKEARLPSASRCPQDHLMQ